MIDLKQIAKDSGLTVEQLSDRIETCRRQGGLTLNIKAGDNHYWLPLSVAEEVLSELYLSE